MAWYHAFGIGRRAAIAPPTVPFTAATDAFSAYVLPEPDRKLVPTVDSWQEEAWGFYQSLGEAGYAVDWKAAMISRVRLRAARLEPGRDEPTIVEDGLAADLMSQFAGGVPGQTQILSSLSVQMDVPGEGFLIGEVVGRRETWTVRSIDEVRVRGDAYQVVDPNSRMVQWRDLSPDSLVVRIWRPDKRHHRLATSPLRGSLSAMRELELVNRHITAQYLSRLASAGIVVIPDEVTFPVREEFEDSVDPFMSEWIEIAATAIKEPGTASSVVPIPIRVPGEYVDKIRHVDFTLELDADIVKKRDAAIKRVATRMNIPPEVLLGMGDVNHWGQWQLEEGALKTNIAPDVELICGQLTTGYLQPRLEASGESNPSQWVVWYDMSELALRPDRSANALQAYDRLEISGTALRREIGFDEDDAPSVEELRELILKKAAANPQLTYTALSDLTGEQVEGPEAPDDPVSSAPEPDVEPDRQGPPDVPDNVVPMPDPQVAAAERKERLTRQARDTHAIRIGFGGSWELLHPPGCADHAYSCPHTHATWNLSESARPGGRGVYECRLDPFGRPVIGPAAPYLDTVEFLTTRGAGHARA